MSLKTVSDISETLSGTSGTFALPDCTDYVSALVMLSATIPGGNGVTFQVQQLDPNTGDVANLSFSGYTPYLTDNGLYPTLSTTWLSFPTGVNSYQLSWTAESSVSSLAVTGSLTGMAGCVINVSGC